MRKDWLCRWNRACRIICILFLMVRVSAFAQPESNANDRQMHEEAGVDVNTQSWETQDLPNMRVRFKVPPGYKQKQWAVSVGPVRIATFQLGHLNAIDFTIESVEDANPENAKIGLQSNYLDYREWSQAIGGHKGVVQTFQGGGVTIDENGKRLPFRVEAVCMVDTKHLLRISAMLGGAERQQEVIEMLKTIEFY